MVSYSAHQHLDTFRLFYYEGEQNILHYESKRLLPKRQTTAEDLSVVSEKRYWSLLAVLKLVFWFSPPPTQGEPVVPMLIAPSVTPSRGPPELNAHNPAVRKIFFNEDTYEVLDVEQWSLDLNKHGDDTIETLKWEKIYSYRSTYDIDYVNAEELHLLAEDFKEYASEKFHVYYELTHVQTEHESNGPCDNDCKVAHICSIEEVYFEDYDRCLEELDISGTAQFNSAGLLLTVLLGSLLGLMRIL